uniref:Lipocln_cytosolic_FA-bd_dom domain-containing protein n=1 Tax=Parastrongyloides trichosuri TaxID=131310 RepID=A0A0N4ZBD7_PARTI
MKIFNIVLASAAFIGTVFSIGESPIDVNTFAGLINGFGYLLRNDIQPIDVPSKLLMGKWYQMYKSALNFDGEKTAVYCSIAYFKENSVMGEDGFSMEEAFRTVTKNGQLETYKRDLNKVGYGKYWMYTEEYFYPRQFHILKAGPNYNNETQQGNIEYFVVSDANRMSLMVYARDPLTFYQNYNKETTEYLEKAGFGGKVFWNSPKPIYQGPDCEYPSEKEVFARRVLKNQENALRAKADAESGKKSSGGAESPIAELLSNPQLALQRLVQRN